MKKLVLFLIVLFGSSLPAAAQLPLKVLTLNTKHGGQAPWSVAAQIEVIVAESPDVVLLQEADHDQLDDYVARLNDGLSTTAWHGAAARHCIGGSPQEGCTAYKDESVMVLSRFPFDETEPRLVWGPDAYFAARAILRAAVRLDDTTVVQVFACHLPPLSNAADLRVRWVAEFSKWAARVATPQIAAGDFNEGPSSAAVAMMARQYVDAWAQRGGGNGATHSRDGHEYRSRIDFVFSRGLDVNGASVPAVSISDHRPVVAIYTVPQGATPRVDAASVSPAAAPAALVTPVSAAPAADGANGETVLMEDNFDAAADAVEKWPGGIVSGMEDGDVSIAQEAGAIAIGPLRQHSSGFHYNGPSTRAFDLSTGGYGQVQLLHGVVGDQANAMFTAANGSTNFYRVYQTGAAGALRVRVEKKIDDVKYQLASVPYDPATQPWLRIRHDFRPAQRIDDVVFEIAVVPPPPGAFVEIYREPWDPAIESKRLVFELKAGTSDKEDAPGVAVWDNFRVALQPVTVP